MDHVARDIAENAYQLSLDPDYMSPFAISANDIGIDLRGKLLFFVVLSMSHNTNREIERLNIDWLKSVTVSFNTNRTYLTLKSEGSLT